MKSNNVEIIRSHQLNRALFENKTNKMIEFANTSTTTTTKTKASKQDVK